MLEKKISILIPCRLLSRRLPKKALRYVTEQKTLIELVYSNTLKAIKELKQDKDFIQGLIDAKGFPRTSVSSADNSSRY